MNAPHLAEQLSVVAGGHRSSSRSMASRAAQRAGAARGAPPPAPRAKARRRTAHGSARRRARRHAHGEAPAGDSQACRLILRRQAIHEHAGPFSAGRRFSSMPAHSLPFSVLGELGAPAGDSRACRPVLRASPGQIRSGGRPGERDPGRARARVAQIGRARPGRQGGAWREALILTGGAGRRAWGAGQSPPSAPANPANGGGGWVPVEMGSSCRRCPRPCVLRARGGRGAVRDARRPLRGRSSSPARRTPGSRRAWRRSTAAAAETRRIRRGFSPRRRRESLHDGRSGPEGGGGRMPVQGGAAALGRHCPGHACCGCWVAVQARHEAPLW